MHLNKAAAPNMVVSISSYKTYQNVRDRASAPFLKMLGQTHMNGWSYVIASQNGDSTDYIFSFRLRFLQLSRYLFNYWNK